MERNFEIESEKLISNRRTFAIISHPDAGKTTLTEKLLLYGNAIDLAGNVRARRNQRNTTSDWMEMERQRGISITSTVLQFPYQGYVINLLDTPGHQDFSEDTYRTLSAVDSAVMVLDAAKGIDDLLYYEVQQDTTSSFANPTTYKIPQTTLTLPTTEEHQSIYIRVRCVNSRFEVGPWSTTANATGIQSGTHHLGNDWT